MNGQAECASEQCEFIQEILRDSFKDPLLVVDQVSCRFACSFGDNFMSVIKRTTVTGVCSAEEKDDDGKDGGDLRGAVCSSELFIVPLNLRNPDTRFYLPV